jgi:hypothetical protein
MSATRLSLYNDALLLAGERAITGLTVVEETRRLLDQVWNNQGVDACLEEGQWMFAMRTVRIDYDPGIEPDYGYSRAFDKPTDWILTSAFCSDEYFRVPILRYVDEAGYWYSDLDNVYVRYVSNDASYGADMSKWPPSFKDFVAAHFATQLVLKITNDERRLAMFVNPANPLHSIRGRALLRAKSRCAMAGPTQILAQGNWSLARTRGVNRRDGGGTSGNLIG